MVYSEEKNFEQTANSAEPGLGFIFCGLAIIIAYDIRQPLYLHFAPLATSLIFDIIRLSSLFSAR